MKKTAKSAPRTPAKPEGFSARRKLTPNPARKLGLFGKHPKPLTPAQQKTAKLKNTEALKGYDSFMMGGLLAYVSALIGRTLLKSDSGLYPKGKWPDPFKPPPQIHQKHSKRTPRPRTARKSTRNQKGQK